ncbi:hypothetical protein TNCV_3300151 [Trichonephila clavipes]|nr:hypothetical protein TNCV_3300151 [Trichonephila clavipes]
MLTSHCSPSQGLLASDGQVTRMTPEFGNKRLCLQNFQLNGIPNSSLRRRCTKMNSCSEVNKSAKHHSPLYCSSKSLGIRSVKNKLEMYQLSGTRHGIINKETWRTKVTVEETSKEGTGPRGALLPDMMMILSTGV